MDHAQIFSTPEQRIYELAGHQRIIDRSFEFMRIVLSALNLSAPLVTPNVGLLSKYWAVCSEFCHIGWPMSSASAEVRKHAYDSLTAVAAGLSIYVRAFGWPLLRDELFIELRDKFVSGAVSDQEVLEFIRARGLWAHVKRPDGGTPHLVGDAVSPRTNSEPGSGGV